MRTQYGWLSRRWEWESAPRDLLVIWVGLYEPPAAGEAGGNARLRQFELAVKKLSILDKARDCCARVVLMGVQDRVDFIGRSLRLGHGQSSADLCGQADRLDVVNRDMFLLCSHPEGESIGSAAAKCRSCCRSDRPMARLFEALGYRLPRAIGKQAMGDSEFDRQKVEAILSSLGALHHQAEEANAPILAYLIEVAVVEAMDLLKDASPPSAVEP
jgi:hypothetical protein